MDLLNYQLFHMHQQIRMNTEIIISELNLLILMEIWHKGYLDPHPTMY